MTATPTTHRHARSEPLFVLVCGLIPAIIMGGLALVRPGFLTGFDDTVYDTILGRAGTNPPAGQVAIVDIDERSLSDIGQWPWGRDTIGTLVDRLHELGATMVALDVMFAESDRHDPLSNTADTGRMTGDSSGAQSLPDARLAETLRRGRVVLGYAFTFEPALAGQSACVLHPLGLAILQPAGEEVAPLFHAAGAVCSLPVLAQAAGASGFLNAAPDHDGILRRVPLLIERDGRVYPGLALAAVAASTGTRDTALRVVNVNTVWLTLDHRVVPLDGKSNLLVRYRGRKNTFPHVSAADVLAGHLSDDAFRGKLVFVGATALGTREVVSTPLDRLFAGVEVQATVADNLLTQDFIRRPEQAAGLEALAAFGAGSAIAWLVATTGLAWGSLVALACLALLWGGAVRLLAVEGAFLSPLYATGAVMLSLASTTFGKLFLERRRAERAGEQHVTSQHLMVQTLLSLMEIRDAETGRHSRRTQRYARLLAEQLAPHPRFRAYLTPARIEMLASLAPLHDIGKVGVPDYLLNKPGQLTTDELAEMRKHPVHGRDVIVEAERRVGVHDDDTLAMAKDIVYTHHERWDGTGYPEGLADEQIPIPGRLVAVVDMYDALVTRRVYRGPLSHDEAVDLIVEGRSTRFDPAVVDAFLEVGAAFRGMSADE